MSDDRHPSFERLGTSNYAEWSLRMEAVLVRKGLWGMVEILVSPFEADGVTQKDAATFAAEHATLVARRPAAKIAEARAELILRVDDAQLAHMTSRDPMVIWETLARLHLAAGFATSLALRRKFLTAKKADGETIESWIGRVEKLVLRMQHAKIDVTDQDKILAYTLGLPPSYEAVIINFDSTPPEQLSVQHVVSRLLNEEARQAATLPPVVISPSLSTAAPITAEEIIGEAMAVLESRRRAAANSASDATCFFCEKRGHFKADCPERIAWTASKSKKSRAIGSAAVVETGLDSDSENDAF